jgi:hypothetical protein
VRLFRVSPGWVMSAELWCRVGWLKSWCGSACHRVVPQRQPNPYKVPEVKRKNSPDHSFGDLTKRGVRSWVRSSLAPRCGDHAAVWLAESTAAAPNTYWDSRGHDPEGSWRRVEVFGSPTRPDALWFPTSRPFRASGSSRWMSRFWQLGCGAGAEVSNPAAFRGGGPSERGTTVPQLVRVAGWSVHTLGTVERREPVGRDPRPLTPPVVSITSHIVFPLQGSFVWVLVGAGSAAHPVDWFPALQPPTHPGLTRVTMRCH